MADLLISNYDNVTIGAIVPRCGEVQKLFLLYNPPYKGLCLDLTEGKTRPWCDDSEPLENATLSNNHRMWGILPLNRGRSQCVVRISHAEEDHGTTVDTISGQM